MRWSNPAPDTTCHLEHLTADGATSSDRIAARNLIRDGDPQHVVMQLCGWKTDAMFRRYDIVDERDLRSAVEMLAKGTTGGQSKVRALRNVG